MPLLEVQQLSKRFINRLSLFRTQDFYAVKSVSFCLGHQETLAIIGDNGAGKSTLAKMIAGMIEPTSGEILLKGTPLRFGDYQARAKQIRMISQELSDVFLPHLNVGQTLDLPLQFATNLNEEERNRRIFQTLKLVGLYPEHALVPITAISSHQKYRVALARALILKPKIIIIDDSLTALDFSVKSQLTNLLLTLQERLGLSYLYVGQNLGIIKHLSDKLMIMDNGNVVEYGNTKEILLNPQHPLTLRLIESHFGKRLTEEAWAE